MTLSWNDLIAMAPQTLLVLGGLGVLISQMLLKSGRARIAWQLTVVTLAAAILVVVVGLSDSKGVTTLLPRAFLGTDVVSAINGTYRYSVFSANAILLFLVLALVAVLFMRQIMPALELNFPENYFLILMSVAGYSYSICAEDLITLFIGLELGSLPLLVLIGLNRQDKATNEAALKYLLLSAFAMAFLLLGIALVYGANATVRLRDIREIGPHFLKVRVMTLAYAFIFTGFFFKLAAFPLHSYVADVYEGSVTVFTGILASLSKAAGALILLKIYYGVHDGYRQYFAPILMFAAIGSMLFGAFASLATQNLKRILAYSSIGHAGFMLCFFITPAATDGSIIGALKQEAGSALYIYLVGYTFASLLAFGTIAFIERSLPPGTPVTLDSLSNLYRRDQGAAIALGISVLSFMGMPPLAGFLGKFFLFKYLAFSNNMLLAAAAAAASAISVYAYIRILRPVFFSEDTAETADKARPFVIRDAARLAAGFLLGALCFFAAFSSFLYNNGIPAIQKIY